MFTWHGACCSCPPVEEKQVRLYLCVCLFVCACERFFGGVNMDVYGYVCVYTEEDEEITRMEKGQRAHYIQPGKPQDASPV